MKLDDLVKRDTNNARQASTHALRQLQDFQVQSNPIGLATGITQAQRERLSYAERRISSLRAIAEQPFQAMAEVIVETEDRFGRITEQEQLWYANENSTINEVFQTSNGRVAILAWTHPGLQLALVTELGEPAEISSQGYSLISVEPKVRARFDAVTPNLSGLYDPGGSVFPRATAEPNTGLKAVKLRMTHEQIKAFISRMSGMMIVTGAPGSGKTTVAFQRVRFLYDQQGERRDNSRNVRYTPELTKVFLANRNLITYSSDLLVNQLARVSYLSSRWLKEPNKNRQLESLHHIP